MAPDAKHPFFQPQGNAPGQGGVALQATINLRGQPFQSATEWISDKPLEVKKQDGLDSVTFIIAPGGIAIIELRTR